MNKTAITIIIIVLILLAGGILLGGSSTTQTNTDSIISPPASDSLATTTAGTAVEKEFTIVAKNFSFNPSTVSVNKGDRLKITVKNVGGFHDLKIDGFGVATKRISDGAEDVVEFTADKTGSFEYYCSVGTHRAMGMKGALTVN
jgi:plastocyanin